VGIVRALFVPSFVKVTVAPATTAPCESVTTPVTREVVPCPKAIPLVSSKMKREKAKGDVRVRFMFGLLFPIVVLGIKAQSFPLQKRSSFNCLLICEGKNQCTHRLPVLERPQHKDRSLPRDKF
jgi:hypothetical protein